ncbi:MAG: transposase [Pannonibacter indicus]
MELAARKGLKPRLNRTDTFEHAVHKLEWYARRWSIETFFKTLKTGCRIEEISLTTADRLANCIALACVTAWRISG